MPERRLYRINQFIEAPPGVHFRTDSKTDLQLTTKRARRIWGDPQALPGAYSSIPINSSSGLTRNSQRLRSGT